MSETLNRREVLIGAAAVVAAAALPQKAEAESVSDWLEKVELEAGSLKDLPKGASA